MQLYVCGYAGVYVREYVCMCVLCVSMHANAWKLERFKLVLHSVEKRQHLHEFRVSSVQVCRIPFSSVYMPYVSEGRTVSLMVTLSRNLVIVSC